MPGELTDKQKASGLFSELLEINVAPIGPKQLRCFVMAPEAKEDLQPLPTILAVSGEEQLHTSLFFRAWRAERRGWQVVIAARESKDTPYLMDKAGLDLLATLTKSILKGQCPVIHPVEGAKLHLVGTSNGGASVLALAARKPDQIASVSVVTGYVPECLKDFGPLGRIPRIRLIGSKQDRNNLQVVLDHLELVRAPVDGLHIVSGANHRNVGEKLDMESFWSWLEASRPKVGGATRATGLAQPAAVPLAAAAEATSLKLVTAAAPAVEVGQPTVSASSEPRVVAKVIEAAAAACTRALEECPVSEAELAALADNMEDRGQPVASASSGRRSRRKGKNKCNAEHEVGQPTASASSEPRVVASVGQPVVAPAIETTAEVGTCALAESPTSEAELAAFASDMENRGQPAASASSGRRSRRKGTKKRIAGQD